MPKTDIQTGLITNCEIGDNGRFGNQIFQYMYLSHHAADHGIGFATPKWDGDTMFCVQPGVDRVPPQPQHLTEDHMNPQTCPIRNAPGSLEGHDVSGYFQFPTKHYASQKARLQQEFAFRGAYGDYAHRMKTWLDVLPGRAVAVHMRRGDYGTGIFFRAPTRWYVDWLRDLQEQVGPLTVYIASDDVAAVLPDFAEFNTVTASDAPQPLPKPGFTADFMALCLARHVAISNSSMSFAATMFNLDGDGFMRPSLSDQALIPYDPWNAPVLLSDMTAEQAGEEFMSERAKSRSKYRIRKFLRLKQ